VGDQFVNEACVMKISRCMVKGIRSFKSERTQRVYESLIVSIGTDDVEISVGPWDLSKAPTLVPVKIEAAVVFHRFGVRQSMEFSSTVPPSIVPV
jgi:hypothetical protein